MKILKTGLEEVLKDRHYSDGALLALFYSANLLNMQDSYVQINIWLEKQYGNIVNVILRGISSNVLAYEKFQLRGFRPACEIAIADIKNADTIRWARVPTYKDENIKSGVITFKRDENHGLRAWRWVKD